MLELAQHPNLLSLKDFYEDQKYFYLIFELCSNDLLGYLNTIKFRLTEAEAKDYTLQMFEGLKALHSVGIVHLDIKLDNIMVLEGPNGKLILKLADFGLSKIIMPGQKLSELVGTRYYVAPEILLDDEYDGRAADIWSTAMSLYVMFMKSLPI